MRSVYVRMGVAGRLLCVYIVGLCRESPKLRFRLRKFILMAKLDIFVEGFRECICIGNSSVQ